MLSERSGFMFVFCSHPGGNRAGSGGMFRSSGSIFALRDVRKAYSAAKRNFLNLKETLLADRLEEPG
jgi:hypothetical protein